MNDQYYQAIKVLKDFGYLSPVSLKDIEKALTSKQKAYIKKHNGQLVITPPLTNKEILEKIKEVYDVPFWIYVALWDQYDFGNDWRVDFVFPELKFTNQTWSEQQASVKKEQKSVKGLQSINPRTYFMLNAINKENGGSLLDTSTFTRLVQYDMKSVVGDSYGLYVYSDGGGFYPDGSYGRAYPNGGVRFVMGLDLDFKYFVSSGYSLASTNKVSANSADLHANTKALNRLSDLLERIYNV